MLAELRVDIDDFDLEYQFKSNKSLLPRENLIHGC